LALRRVHRLALKLRDEALFRRLVQCGVVEAGEFLGEPPRVLDAPERLDLLALLLG
jgi:hypothetical protein